MFLLTGILDFVDRYQVALYDKHQMWYVDVKRSNIIRLFIKLFWFRSRKFRSILSYLFMFETNPFGW